MELKYQPATSTFLVNDGEDDHEIYKFNFDSTPTANCFDKDDISKYEYFELFKKDVREDDYHCVSVNVGNGGGNPQRFGWLLPITTLTTEDATILSEKYLAPYAYLALAYILKDENIQNRLLDGETFTEVVEESYRNKCLFIVKKEQFDAFKYFSRIELPLAEKGFFIKDVNVANPLLKADKGDMLLTPVKSIVNPDGTYLDDYIQEYYTKHISERNTFLRFMYLYQILEALLDRLLICKIEELLDGAKRHQVSAREVDNTIKEYTEMKRLNKILTDAGLNNEVFEDLDRACNEFLNRKNKYKQPESVYQTRCHIIHCFRDVLTDTAKIDEIIKQMEPYVIRVLCSYKIV